MEPSATPGPGPSARCPLCTWQLTAISARLEPVAEVTACLQEHLVEEHALDDLNARRLAVEVLAGGGRSGE